MKNELLTQKEDIIAWLKDYGVRDYEIIESPEYGYMVNTNGDVRLSDTNLDFIAVKFNIVSGSFTCSHNHLKSLLGSPNIVKDCFHCVNNKIKSLEHGPKGVKWEYNCSQNQLITLQGAPSVTGTFHCGYNILSNLHYAPKKINGNFVCTTNRLTSFEGAPKIIEGYLSLSKNPISFINIKDLPDYVEQFFILDNTHIAEEVGQNKMTFSALKEFLMIKEEQLIIKNLIKAEKSNKIIKL